MDLCLDRGIEGNRVDGFSRITRIFSILSSLFHHDLLGLPYPFHPSYGTLATFNGSLQGFSRSPFLCYCLIPQLLFAGSFIIVHDQELVVAMEFTTDRWYFQHVLDNGQVSSVVWTISFATASSLCWMDVPPIKGYYLCSTSKDSLPWTSLTKNAPRSVDVWLAKGKGRIQSWFHSS